MKKTYTKKQITEAIAYWKKQLQNTNEALTGVSLYQNFWNSIPDNQSILIGMTVSFNVYDFQGGDLGPMTDEQFNYFIESLSKKYGVDIRLAGGYGSEDGGLTSISISGNKRSVKTIYGVLTDELYKELGWDDAPAIEELYYNQVHSEI